MLHGASLVAQKGLNLLELLVSITLAGVLLGLALPGLQQWSTTTSIQGFQSSFISMLKLARNSAVTRNVTVTVCGSISGRQCDGAWASGSIIFTDHNADARVDADEQVLHSVATIEQIGLIHWRSFGNRQYLQITAAGFTNNQSGSFTFCPSDRDISKARQIIINRTGRIRLASDRNHDGIYEDSAGKPLRC